jgi:type I restriction-modification system DNA methylase subunit
VQVATDLQDFSRTHFAAANQLWTNSTLHPDQYAQPVLALIALRQMEAKFEAVHAELAPKYKGRLKSAPADYQAKGAIFLPENSRFSGLLALPGAADLGAELNATMKGVADTNPDLAGALPLGYAPDWQAAMEALILVATLGGPTMFARIGVMRALNRHVKPPRNSARHPDRFPREVNLVTGNS